MNLILPSMLVACLAIAVAAAEPAKVPDFSIAPEKATVFAVAKVDGRTRRIDGQLYYLVAIRLNPLMMRPGATNSVLALGGHIGSIWAVEEADQERALEDELRRYQLRWLRLPDEGSLEVVWGSLTYPVEKEGVLRDRLVKSGYVPFRVDLRKFPALEAGSAKELLAALDELAKRPIPKPDPDGTMTTTTEVKGRLVYGVVFGYPRKAHLVTVGVDKMVVVLEGGDEAEIERLAALEGKLVVERGQHTGVRDPATAFDPTRFFMGLPRKPKSFANVVVVKSVEEAR